MRKTVLSTILLAGWWLAAPAALHAEIDVLTATPAELYEHGFAEFEPLSHSTEKRLNGYALMIRAAVAGHHMAKMTVANYDAGFVTPSQHQGAKPMLEPNLTRAVRFLRELADAGHGNAQVNLAVLYSSGVGEPRHDGETPQALLLKAAEHGNDDAMAHLSRRYLLGHGVPHNRLEAARWFYRAFVANAHATPAMIDESGKPLVQENAHFAECAATVSLFARAHRGDGAAAAQLADLYAEAGREAEALALYKLAVQRGQRAVAEKVQEMTKALDEEDEPPPAPPLTYFFGEVE